MRSRESVARHSRERVKLQVIGTVYTCIWMCVVTLSENESGSV